MSSDEELETEEEDLEDAEPDLEAEDFDEEALEEELEAEEDIEGELEEEFEAPPEDEAAEDEETAEALDELEAEELELLEDEVSASLLVDEVAELRAIRREELTLNVEAHAIRNDEFVCTSCFLVKRTSQLANKRKMICRDCAS